MGRVRVNVGCSSRTGVLIPNKCYSRAAFRGRQSSGPFSRDSGLALCLSLPFRISATILVLNISPQSVGMFCLFSLEKNPHCHHSPGIPDHNICIAFEILTNEVNFPQWMFLPACVFSLAAPSSHWTPCHCFHHMSGLPRPLLYTGPLSRHLQQLFYSVSLLCSP